MAYIMKQKNGGKIGIEEISAEELMKIQTLMRWMKDNPSCWVKIKEFVYRKELNKKAKRVSLKL